MHCNLNQLGLGSMCSILKKSLLLHRRKVGYLAILFLRVLTGLRFIYKGAQNEDPEEDPDRPMFSLVTGKYRHAKRYGDGEFSSLYWLHVRMRTSFTFRPRIRYGNKYSTFTKSYPALQRKRIITNIRQRSRYSLSLIFLITGRSRRAKHFRTIPTKPDLPRAGSASWARRTEHLRTRQKWHCKRIRGS